MDDLLKTKLVDFSNKRSSVNKFVDYNDYIHYQTVIGMSHEINCEHWANGQIICINEKFATINKNAKILIASCGDGVCLAQLKTLGFTDVTGLEICDEKIALARKSGFNVIKTDICTGPFDLNGQYDVIYSSHTLEHVLNPIFTFKSITNFLKEDGIIHLILPYPDINAGNPEINHRFKVHCGVIPLGLNIDDNGQSVCDVFTKEGFNIISKNFYSYREPEIHLVMSK
jgi:SAM-dependent methyltransferase